MSYLQVDVPAEGERGPPLPEFLQTWPPADSYEVRQCTDSVCQENCRTRQVIHLGRCAGRADARCSGEGQVLLQNSYATETCEMLWKVEGRMARDDAAMASCDDGFEYARCPTTVTAATGPPADIQQMRVGYASFPQASTTCTVDTLVQFTLFQNASCSAGVRYTELPSGLVLEVHSFNDPANCTGGTPTEVTHVGACEPATADYATRYISAQSPGAAQYPFACAFGWGACGSESSSTGESGDDSSSSSSSSSSGTGNSTASSSSSSSSSSGDGNNAASSGVQISGLALFGSLMMALMGRA